MSDTATPDSTLVETTDEHRTHADVVRDLTARWPEHRVAPSLGRISALTELLGDPQRAYPVIHVTGTNGKGSTTAMIESLLRAAGLRTGRYTSPHLTSLTERITIDGEPVSDERFDELWAELEPYVAIVDAQEIDGVACTFFEIMTAMAFAAFADAPVDVAVIEVGLGGTWDATNVADAGVAVVTPIDLDHTHLLGTTVAEIAREKAGIIKPGAHAILAGQSLEAAQVLLERCAEVGALPQREGIDFGVLGRQLAVDGQLVRLNGAEGPVEDVFIPLHGAHQASNAALALAAVEAFLGLKGLNADVARDGFAEAVNLLGLITGSLGKVAYDIMLMASTEFGEVYEPFVTGRGASSTMPQKRNPISSELMLAAAKGVRQHAGLMLDAMIQDFERATGPWHAEWMAVPEAFVLTAGALHQARFALGGLIVDEARTEAHLRFIALPPRRRVQPSLTGR
jgi:folylpolyglutamate synthase/dihydropteroate synthase